jgi:hypothetical protein
MILLIEMNEKIGNQMSKVEYKNAVLIHNSSKHSKVFSFIIF